MPFPHWDKLLYGIERGECILFLGPELSVQGPDRSQQVPAASLARRLLKGLDDEGLSGFDPTPSDLRWIAQRYIAQEDAMSLERELEEWHGEWKDRPSPLHDDLAALPFRLVITSGLDPLMEHALRRADKAPEVERYHYRGRNKELLPIPTSDAPVLFHLYGVVDDPQSIVLTEMQLLDFLAHLIARDPPLPNDLNEALTNGRLFLFLGFGLRQWYLRILFHVLKVLRPDSRGFAIEALEGGAMGSNGAGSESDPAIFFYRDNFKKMDLFREDPAEFVRELRERYLAAGGPSRVESQPGRASEPVSERGEGRTVFICHASEDKEKATEVYEALQRAGLEPWLDRNAIRGGDRWDDLIESTIQGVDYFVVLNSHALAAKSQEASYVNKEIRRALAAEELRLIGHFIVPVLIDDTPLLGPLGEFPAVDLRAADGLRQLVRDIKRQVVAGGGGG